MFEIENSRIYICPKMESKFQKMRLCYILLMMGQSEVKSIGIHGL